jgi:hypothetical protein
MFADRDFSDTVDMRRADWGSSNIAPVVLPEREQRGQLIFMCVSPTLFGVFEAPDAILAQAAFPVHQAHCLVSQQ